MRMKLIVLDKEAQLDIVADTDFEKDTLVRLKKNFQNILVEIDCSSGRYGDYDQSTPTAAAITMSFLPERPAEKEVKS